MNELEIFKNPEFGEVRTVVIQNEPYFLGKDVAEILGYERGTKAVRDHVDDEDIDEIPIQDSIGRQRITPFINESGLYSLILSSKLPEAKKFKRWITSEVIPSIRKHGAYATDEVIEKVLESPEFGIQLLTNLKNEREKNKELSAELAQKSNLIETLQPKAAYYDLILQCSGLLPVTDIAKDYGMTAQTFNKKLHELGVQYFQSGRWYLYAKYEANAYTQSKTTNFAKKDGSQGCSTHMYWTQKGRLFLYDFLKEHGVLPMIEREQQAV